MSVRAKFVVVSVSSVQHHRCEKQESVEMQPVIGSSEENKSWSKYTPSGSLKMTITNPEAMAQFELGKEFYLDFTACEAK
jgi:hypothetical protein